MKKTFFALFLTSLFSGVGLAQTREDSLAAPRVWLRSDLHQPSGSDWKDAGLYANHAVATTATQLPASTQLLNYNPAVVFDGLDDYLEVPFTLDGLAELSVLVVFQSADTTERAVWGTSGGVREILMTTRQAVGPDTVHDFYGKHERLTVLGSLLQSWDNTNLSTSEGRLGIAASPNGAFKPFRGALAELIVFNRALTFLERVQYETYLAIKYGTGLQAGNFVSSGEQVLWHVGQNAAFGNDIAGIGRDDVFKLNQKQSGSAYDSSLLVMSAGKLRATNAENSTTLADGDFILFGSNGQPLATQRGEGPDSILSVLRRKWLVTATGNTSDAIATELHVDQSRFPAHGLGYWLVVDRSGAGNFSVDNLEYIEPEGVVDGKTVYNIFWDTDRSGKDNFGFARAHEFFAVVRTLQAPLCSDESAGEIRIEVLGGAPPYKFALTNAEANISHAWRSGERSATQDDLVAGTYSLSVSDDADDVVDRVFTLVMPDVIEISLGEDRVFTDGQPIVLDVSSQVPPTVPVKWKWENNFGFSSTEKSITVPEPGIYRVFVTRQSDGCVFTDDVRISGSETQRTAVYPTIVGVNENYNVGVSLDEAASVIVRVYNSRGLMVDEMRDSGNTEYQFITRLRDSGMYVVVIQTPNGTETHKLIVH